MRTLKKFSIARMIERFGQSVRRFPVAMLFTLFLTGFLIFMNHGGKVGNKWEFFLVFYPATASLLAVALTLITEDFKNRLADIAVQVVVHGLWLGVSLYLARFDRFSTPQLIAVCATIAAMSLAVFVACFYRKHQDIQFWNFSIRTVLGLAVSVIIGGLLTMGLFALLQSLSMLFGMIIQDKAYGDIAAVCMAFLAPALFMNLIPNGENKFLNEAPEFSGFAKGVAQYLFLPLLGTYMITLYAYGIKILMQWSLPVGGVSYLVSGSMVLMVLLIYLTFPLQHQEGNKFFKMVTRWLPVMMFPLLALMTVAIWRRLSDYGITVSRLYLLVFNLWCYAVCLWLIFTRNRRIWLIPASFAAILLLISVGPQSIANVTQRQLKKEALSAFTASGFIREIPLTGQQYEQWLKQADNKVAKSIDSKLHYLEKDFGYTAIKDLLASDAITGRFSSIDEEGNIITVIRDEFSNYGLISNVAVPQGYKTMTAVRGGDINIIKIDGDKMWFKVEDGNQVEHQFEIDVKQFIERDIERNDDKGAQPLVVENGEAQLVINDFNITVYNHSSNIQEFSGILFTK